MRPSRERLRNLGAALALAGLATGCVSSGGPGVAVDAVEADLVFGLEERPKLLAPANTQPGTVPSDFAAQPAIDVVDSPTVFKPFRNPAADRLPPIGGGGGTTPPVEECPTAPNTAAARDAAESHISGEIREGVYAWKREGVQRQGDVEVPITGFERRVVRNVEPASDRFDEDAYTFEVVQVLVDRPVVQVTTYLVKPDTAGQAQVAVPPAPATPRQGEPERGISIIRLEQFDEDGNGLGSTDFSSGLLQIPLPVVPNESFHSVAVSRFGDTYVQDGTVGARARVDACGDLVDGWRVHATQSSSNQPGEVELSYLIATQYGGMPVQEQISMTGADGSTFDVIFTLAQLDPSPLEAP